MSRYIIASILALALAGPVQAQQPSEATRAANAAALAAASADEVREAAEDAAARRGLIAQIPDGIITDAAGGTIWDWRPYAFLNNEAAPPTVHPRLWRQARRNAQHGLFEVVPGAIWQVRGYDLAVMTVIRGSNGWIIIDPLTSEEAARASLDLVNRNLGARPVTAVIFSHSHSDHFGGVGGVTTRAAVAAGAVRIIAPHGFTRAAVAENVLAGPAMQRRASYMFGTSLAPGANGQVDSGLGPRIAGGTIGFMEPTESVGPEGATLTVDGVEIQFIDAANTEAPSEFLFYLPRWRALHTTEVATKTLHNLLTLRGALIRDALVWSRVIDAAAQRWGDAEVQLASHGWPTFGQDNVRTYLAGQRDMYRFIHDRTIGAANRGATLHELPDILAATSLGVDPSARGYYGTVNHNAKAVYQRYFGWWDGVPANYNPLPPVEAARGYVDLAGGPERLLTAGRAALAAGNPRWAAELLNHLVFAQPGNSDAKAALADAYEQLGFQAESGSWRNYYLAAAATLRGTEQSDPVVHTQSADFIAAVPTLDLFDSLATRLSATAAVTVPQYFRFNFPDRNETVTVERRGVIEIPRPGEPPVAATAGITLTRQDFAALLTGRARFPELMASGRLRIDGDLAALLAWLQAHSPPDPRFNVVVP